MSSGPFLIVQIVVALAFLARAYSAVDDKLVGEWAQAHALRLTDENAPMVRWYLHTARVLRTWGVIGGIVLPDVITAAVGGRSGVGQPVWVFIGYLIGALYAEVALVRRAPDGRRAATLHPRELSQYIPRRILIAQRVVPVLVVLGAITVFLVPYGHRSGWEGFDRPVGIAITAVFFALAFGLGLERLERWIVERPQPFTEPSLVAADDAIRSQSVHSLGGSGVAGLLVAFSVVAGALSMCDVTALRWTMFPFAIFGFFASIVVCQYFSYRAWRVRRSPVPHAVVQAARPVGP